MNAPIKITLKSGECAQLFVGEAGGFRLLVCRLKSLAETRTMQAAEPGRATGKGFDTVARPRFQNGYTFQRNGKYVLRYREDIIQRDGTLRRIHRAVTLGFFPKKKDAKRAGQAHLRLLNSPSYQPQAGMSFEDFWHTYFVPEMLPTLKFSTRRLYTCLARKHLLPAFGNWKLNEIARVHIQHFLTVKKQRGSSVQTLAHLRNLLSKTFSVALSWGWLADNPAHGVKLPPMERVRESRVLTPTEIDSLARTLEAPARRIFLTALLAGLRIGEVLALRLQDVELNNGRLYVRQDVYCGQVGSPKTKRSERSIPLGPGLALLLRHWLAKRPALGDWLFPSEVGTPFHDRNLLTRKLWPTCDRLGIPRFGWHSLRHTFQTAGGNRGVPMPVMASLAGHTSLDTTMRYMHEQEPTQREAMREIEKVLCSNVLEMEGSAAIPGEVKTLIQ